MSDAAQPNAHALKLGQLIVSQNPYGQARALGEQHPPAEARSYQQDKTNAPAFVPRPVDAAMAAGKQDVNVLEFDGKADGFYNADGHRLTVEDVAGLRDIPEQGVWWYFQGKPRYIAKALRIPYTYTIKDKTGKSFEVNDWLLIGFEGAGW